MRAIQRDFMLRLLRSAAGLERNFWARPRDFWLLHYSRTVVESAALEVA